MDLQYKTYSKNEYDSLMRMIDEDREQREYLRSVLEPESGKLRVAYGEEEILGLVQIEPEKDTSFVIVYVPINHRGKGIGKMLLKYAEEELQKHQTKKIMTTYSMSSETSKSFAEGHGYERLFASAYLKHTRGRFPLEKLPVRQYRDEDFPDAYLLSSKAFHEMRLRVGDFPDSVVGEPNDSIRDDWRKERENAYVYLYDGEIAGYGSLEGNEIESISVRSDLQGKGIGKMFIMYLSNELYNRGNKEIFLWCVVGNGARTLYDRLGYEELLVSEFAVKSIKK